MSLASVVALLLALVLFVPTAASAQARAQRGHLDPVEGEVIVRFKADAGVLRAHPLAARADTAVVAPVLDRRAAMLGARHGRVLQAGNAVGQRMQVMRAAGVGAVALAAQLAADPDVEFAVPNGRRHRQTAPNDPLYLSGPPVNTLTSTGGPAVGQWYLRAPTASLVSAIDIETAWAYTLGTAGTVVAVLDTGVRKDHPDFAGRLLPGYDFISNPVVANDGDGRDADPSDPGDWVTSADARTSTFASCRVQNSSWHGTSTASLVGAATNDGIGMAGTAPGVLLLPVRVLGKCFGTDDDIVAAMLWSAGIHVDGVPDNANPAKVLNLSLGGCLSNGDCSCNAVYQSAVDQLVARGVTIVVSAGNSNGGPVEPPGNCAGVVAVAAVRHAGTKVDFSSIGPEVALAAPGGNCGSTTGPCLYPVLAASNSGTRGPAASTWWDSFFFELGTSFSAPLVAGTAALMVSLRPELTPAQVRSRLQATARPFPTSGVNAGDGSIVSIQCKAPANGVEQLQCYCTASTCGTGMLDAGAAVAAVAGPVARIDVATATAGSLLTLNGAGSTPAANAAGITGYAWAITDGASIAGALTTNAATATITPTAAGSFTVQLTVTDNLGGSASTARTVTVAAAPAPAAPAAPGGGGGGGGAVSPWWLAGLGAAVLVLVKAGRRAV